MKFELKCIVQVQCPEKVLAQDCVGEWCVTGGNCTRKEDGGQLRPWRAGALLGQWQFALISVFCPQKFTYCGSPAAV